MIINQPDGKPSLLVASKQVERLLWDTWHARQPRLGERFYFQAQLDPLTKAAPPTKPVGDTVKMALVVFNGVNDEGLLRCAFNTGRDMRAYAKWAGSLCE